MKDYNEVLSENEDWWTKGGMAEQHPSIKCPPEIAAEWLRQIISKEIGLRIVEPMSSKKLLPKFDYDKYFADHPGELERVLGSMLQSTKTLTGKGEN